MCIRDSSPHTFRRTINRIHFLSLTLLLVICGSSVSGRASEAARDGFVLQDFLGRTWRNEAVRFPLSPSDAQHVVAKHALMGPDNKPIAYQIVSQVGGKPSAIEFMADLDPLQKNVYKFSDKAGAPIATDLKIEETATTIRLTNSRVGIAIRKKLAAGEGPIESIRLQSGKWIGGSRLDPKEAPTAYSAKIVNNGPVLAEVLCEAQFGEGSTWRIDFRLNAGEPVVLVDENMALGAKSSTFNVSLSENFQPNKVFYRHQNGPNAAGDITPGTVYLLEPWLHWWGGVNKGLVFSVYNEAEPDLLSVASREGGVWVDPEMPSEQRARENVPAMQDEQGLHLDFELKNGQRKWMISSLEKEPSLGILNDEGRIRLASIPIEYQIKQGHFPLNQVKDYVLKWDSEKDQYPRLLVTQNQVAKFRKSLTAEQKAEYEAQVERYRNYGFGEFSITDPLATYYATGDKVVGEKMVAGAVKGMQWVIDFILTQPRGTWGSAPHVYPFIGEIPMLVDAALGTEDVDPETRQRLLAQLAFMSYALNSPGYWSPERGYAANPNMTTTVNGYRTVVAATIPSHPKAREWVNAGLTEIKAQLDGWYDANGGALESPHYAMVSVDMMLGALVMAHNAGINDYLLDPKVKNLLNYFSKISTPPDSRFGGFRHLPPIGDSYINEPTGEFAIAAGLFKDQDPEFASNMQWMHRQHRSWGAAGIGGGGTSFVGFRGIITDPAIPEVAPKYESEIFPNVAVMLRSNFPTERENQLLLLAGSFGGWRSHWGNDSGSMTIWGKGRIIADDFGYTNEGSDVDDHNMLDAPEVRAEAIFNVSKFETSKDFDYVSGSRGAWRRQIGFVKGSTTEPNYFVLRETAQTAAPGVLRLWLTAEKVTTGANRALVVGKDDVDTDIFFITPHNVALTTEERTRKVNAGVDAEGRIGGMSTTQIGLIASTPTAGATMYVIYPRLKNEKAPVVTSLADGKGVKIQSAAGTDYVFLSTSPFTFKEGAVSFSGTSGSVKIRGENITLSVGEGGSIAAHGKSLKK